MHRKHYILENEKMKEVDLMTWGRWLDNADRHIGDDRFDNGVRVSTVFLGIDHGLGERPLWFETMVFGLPDDEEVQERYQTIEEAKEGHARYVEKYKPSE